MIFDVASNDSVNDIRKECALLREFVEVKAVPVNQVFALGVGFSFGADTYVRQIGNFIEFYLSLYGTFPANGTSWVGGFTQAYMPHALNNTRVFPMIMPESGWSSSAFVDTSTGVLRAVTPDAVTNVVIPMTYTIINSVG